MAMNFQNPGSRLTTGNRYAQMLMNQPNANNGTTTGGLAHALRQGMAGYLMGKDKAKEDAMNESLAKYIKSALAGGGGKAPGGYRFPGQAPGGAQPSLDDVPLSFGSPAGPQQPIPEFSMGTPIDPVYADPAGVSDDPTVNQMIGGISAGDAMSGTMTPIEQELAPFRPQLEVPGMTNQDAAALTNMPQNGPPPALGNMPQNGPAPFAVGLQDAPQGAPQGAPGQGGMNLPPQTAQLVQALVAGGNPQAAVQIVMQEQARMQTRQQTVSDRDLAFDRNKELELAKREFSVTSEAERLMLADRLAGNRQSRSALQGVLFQYDQALGQHNAERASYNLPPVGELPGYPRPSMDQFGGGGGGVGRPPVAAPPVSQNQQPSPAVPPIGGNGQTAIQFGPDGQPMVAPSVAQPAPAAPQQSLSEMRRARELQRAREDEAVKTGGVYLTPAQKKIDESFGTDYAEFVAAGAMSDTQKNIGQLDDVIVALKSGKDNLTGPVLGLVPNSIRSMTNPESVSAQDAIEEVVQRNLRLILGAQFTENEGKRLIARAYNPQLSEAENAKRVSRLQDTMRRAYEAKLAAAQYYEANGTLQGYEGTKTLTMRDINEDFDRSVSESGAAGSYGPDAGGSNVIDFNDLPDE